MTGRTGFGAVRQPARRTLLGLPLLAGAAAFAGPCRARSAPADPLARLLSPWRGPAPAGTGLIDLNQQPASLQAYRGRWLVVNLWATWCGPCREEMPSLARLRARLTGRPVELVALSLGDSINQIEQFLSRGGLDLPILIDPQKRLMSQWQVGVLPTTVVFDPQGRPRYRHAGAREWDAQDIVEAFAALNVPA